MLARNKSFHTDVWLTDTVSFLNSPSLHRFRDDSQVHVQMVQTIELGYWGVCVLRAFARVDTPVPTHGGQRTEGTLFCHYLPFSHRWDFPAEPELVWQAALRSDTFGVALHLLIVLELLRNTRGSVLILEEIQTSDRNILSNISLFWNTELVLIDY